MALVIQTPGCAVLGEARSFDGGPDGSVAASTAVEGTLGEPSTCTSTSVFAVDERNEVVQIRRGGSRGHVDAPGGPLVALDASRSGALLAAYRDGRVLSLKVAP